MSPSRQGPVRRLLKNHGTTYAEQAGIAVGCAVVFAVLNACLVAVAAWLAEPAARLVDMLWDRERMLLDLTETCVGVLVTIACALSRASCRCRRMRQRMSR